MSEFSFAADDIALPTGAFARTSRRRLRHRRRTVLALTSGAFRPYVYPLLTPSGVCVSAEAPADHPHHSSLWIAADHVNLKMPAADGTIEAYSYNFYVNETFQGRAPGRIVETGVSGEALPDGSFRIIQEIEWRGPSEWGAPQGRIAAHERRTTRVEPGDRHHRIDIVSRLTAGEWAIALGPTRHAFFNIRVADSMTVANGGRVTDDRGRSGGARLCGEGSRWVDFSGPVGGGMQAGVTVVPHEVADSKPFWFVADWGVVTVGAFRRSAIEIGPGAAFESGASVIVHDGDLEQAEVPRLAETMPEGSPC